MMNNIILYIITSLLQIINNYDNSNLVLIRFFWKSNKRKCKLIYMNVLQINQDLSSNNK